MDQQVLVGTYEYGFVALSVLIAVLAAYATLDLAGRIAAARGRAQYLWLSGGSIAMGTGIWAMHYLGMVALDLPIPLQFDWPTVLVSLVAAVLASGIALFIVSRATMSKMNTLVGSIFMGGGIAAMHYIGMAAMRVPALMHYSTAVVLLSVVLAIAISFVALLVAFNLPERDASGGWRKVGAAVALGIAIPIMHYVGMAAVSFTASTSVMGGTEHLVSDSFVGRIGVVTVTSIILATVIIASIVNRRFSQQQIELEDSRSQLRTIFDHMTDGIVVINGNLHITQMNQAASDLFGVGQEYVGKTVEDMFELFSGNGKSIPRDEWPSAQALRGQFVHNLELTMHRKDTDKFLLVEISTTPILNRKREHIQTIISYRDITETHRGTEARARLAAIVDSSQDAIVGKDEKGIVRSWNAAAERIFGYTAAEMIGQPILKLVPADLKAEEWDFLDRIRRGEIVEHIETLRKRKDGKIINVALTISPIRDSKGNITGASKTARDITERKQLERQLQQSQKMEAIGQLTGGIAHDFNNLLGVITGNLDLLENLVSGNDAALTRIQTALKAAGRGADLTRRLLAFSRREQLKPAFTQLQDAIRNTIELASSALGPEINITTHFDETLPAVFVDASGLENALLNIAVNARDAMPKGGTLSFSIELKHVEESYPSVKIGELKSGTYACVSVSDTGFGMSRETLERAFEPFFSTKPRGKGTGLGLAMVYGFIKQSGGTVRLYSELDYGTTVSLYLPLASDPIRATVEAAKRDYAAQPGDTALVVDDETDLLEIAASYLSEMGYKVLQATDGPSALEIIAREKDKNIDLMITDIIMPGGMSGVDLVERARKIIPAMKIIYSSGFTADALIERSGTWVEGFLLHKPYYRSEFHAAVRDAMESKDDPGGNRNTETSPTHISYRKERP
jgi:PAS domain S-box-containing protein